jgi:glycerol uptake facilitator-like aquaporin
MFTISVALFFSRHFAISTGCLNPAVAIGLQFMFGLRTGNWEILKDCWVFILGPLIGSCLGAWYYDYIYTRSYPRKSIS